MNENKMMELFNEAVFLPEGTTIELTNFTEYVYSEGDKKGKRWGWGCNMIINSKSNKKVVLYCEVWKGEPDLIKFKRSRLKGIKGVKFESCGQSMTESDIIDIVMKQIPKQYRQLVSIEVSGKINTYFDEWSNYRSPKSFKCWYTYITIELKDFLKIELEVRIDKNRKLYLQDIDTTNLIDLMFIYE